MVLKGLNNTMVAQYKSNFLHEKYFNQCLLSSCTYCYFIYSSIYSGYDYFKVQFITNNKSKKVSSTRKLEISSSRTHSFFDPNYQALGCSNIFDISTK